MPSQTGAGYWRDKLQLTVERLSAELVSIESELIGTRALRANGGDDDEHDPDGIPLSSVLQQLEGQRLRLIAQSRETASALSDLARGNYGICERCSRPIGAARLEIRPTARTCVKCAAQPR